MESAFDILAAIRWRGCQQLCNLEGINYKGTLEKLPAWANSGVDELLSLKVALPLILHLLEWRGWLHTND